MVNPPPPPPLPPPPPPHHHLRVPRMSLARAAVSVELAQRLAHPAVAAEALTSPTYAHLEVGHREIPVVPQPHPTPTAESVLVSALGPQALPLVLCPVGVFRKLERMKFIYWWGRLGKGGMCVCVGRGSRVRGHRG